MSHFSAQPLSLNALDLHHDFLNQRAAQVEISLSHGVQGVEGLLTETKALQQVAESLVVAFTGREAELGETAFTSVGGHNLMAMLNASQSLLFGFARGLAEQQTILNRQLAAHDRIINNNVFLQHNLEGRVDASQRYARLRLRELRAFLVNSQDGVRGAEGALVRMRSEENVAAPLPLQRQMSRLISSLTEGE